MRQGGIRFIKHRKLKKLQYSCILMIIIINFALYKLNERLINDRKKFAVEQPRFQKKRGKWRNLVVGNKLLSGFTIPYVEMPFNLYDFSYRSSEILVD
ncbi:hypothetical protein EBB07_08830 [Paenibacillaceae bacterium]|nr:hypothetical protein EBB07_08830 [Paenibacillaceae bacterium]